MKTIIETFTFPQATVVDLADVLANAPLVGSDSIFGDRTARATSSTGNTRTISGFEPAPIPLLRFDVTMRQRRTEDRALVIVEFSQPAARRPYLEGEFLWTITDSETSAGAVLHEEINTVNALTQVEAPLDGDRPSFRRWLFFAGGHQRLMRDVEKNLNRLLDIRLRS